MVNTKLFIWGIILSIFGITMFIWYLKHPLYNKNDDDGSIKSGVAQWGRRNDDIRGYIAFVSMIIVGIIFICKGIGNV